MLKTTLSGFLVVGLLLLSSPEAQAGSPVNCGPNQSWDGQKCQIIVTTGPGSGGGQATAYAGDGLTAAATRAGGHDDLALLTIPGLVRSAVHGRACLSFGRAEKKESNDEEPRQCR